MKYIKMSFLSVLPWVTFQRLSQRLTLPRGGGGWREGKEEGERGGGREEEKREERGRKERRGKGGREKGKEEGRRGIERGQEEGGRGREEGKSSHHLPKHLPGNALSQKQRREVGVGEVGGGAFSFLLTAVVRNHCFQQMHQRPNSTLRAALGPLAYNTQKIWLGEGRRGRRQRPGVDRRSDKGCPVMQEKQAVKTKCKRTHALDSIFVKV